MLLTAIYYSNYLYTHNSSKTVFLKLCTSFKKKQVLKNLWEYFKQHKVANLTEISKIKIYCDVQFVFPHFNMPSIQSLGLEVHSVPEPRRRVSKTLKPDSWGLHALYANYNSSKLLFISMKTAWKIHTWFATLLISGNGLYLRFGLWDQ